MFRRCIYLGLIWGLLAALPATAANLEDIQRGWARANYELAGEPQLKAFEELTQQSAAALEADPDNAELLIWDGIVKSTRAGAVGGLGALSLVKAARQSLERALLLDPKALDGSAYTSLGALYYQVPGWPLAFGDKKKARQFLTKALEMNPEGIDSNYFYGDFLLTEKDYDGARTALEKAMAAPPRPSRPVADAGRRKEIMERLEALPG